MPRTREYLANWRSIGADSDGEENEAMTGIQYVTDARGRKVAVQIDLTKNRALWEDIQDVLISRSRRHEKRIPLAAVKAGLVKSGKLPRG
jgi:hypothetical protein